MSAVIFRNAVYTASAMNDGSLIVTKNRTQQGKRLERATEWIDAISTALDIREGAALCRAVMEG